MSWPRLKKKIESLFAASVRGRLAIHMTSYRGANAEAGRAWITVDGKETQLTDFRNYYTYTRRALEIQREAAPGSSYDGPSWDQAETEYGGEGSYFQWSVHWALTSYLQLSINAALDSPHVLHRAFALVDRRLGRRRFEARLLDSDEHHLVIQLQALRAEAEGWRVPEPGAA